MNVAARTIAAMISIIGIIIITPRRGGLLA
jgi:hypothetical protein